jgi:hypothetical protein
MFPNVDLPGRRTPSVVQGAVKIHPRPNKANVRYQPKTNFFPMNETIKKHMMALSRPHQLSQSFESTQSNGTEGTARNGLSKIDNEILSKPRIPCVGINMWEQAQAPAPHITLDFDSKEVMSKGSKDILPFFGADKQPLQQQNRDIFS